MFNVEQTRLTLRAWLGFGMMVLSGAAILYLQTFWDWNNKAVTPYGAGGGGDPAACADRQKRLTDS